MIVNIFVKVEECDDTDSNKTEVEEIEMVDMEGRAEVKIETDVNLFFQKSMISQSPQIISVKILTLTTIPRLLLRTR